MSALSKLLTPADGKTTNTTVPWKGAQPYITRGMQTAGNYLKKGVGFQAPKFQTYVGMSGTTKSALDATRAKANEGNPLAQQSIDSVTGLLSGNSIDTESGLQGLYGQNPNALQQNVGGIASGAEGIDTGGAYGDMYNSDGISTGGDYRDMYNMGGPDALQQYGSGIASGAEGINTEGQYNNLYGQAGNPYWEQQVNNQSNKIADQVSRQYSGLGRSGSGADTADLVKQIGDYRTGALSDAWDKNIANQRGILGDISGVQGQNIGNRLAAAGALSGEQQQGISDQFNALQGETGVQGQNIANRFSALAGQTGVEGQNLANRMGAAGALSGEQQQGFSNNRGLLGDIGNVQQMNVNNRLSAVAAAPGAYEQQYAPMQHLAQVGAAYDDLNARKLQAKIDRFNTNSQAPWNRLNAYNAAISGNAQGTGSTTQTVQMPNNPFGTIAGLALGGASLATGGGLSRL